jgi:uncharacterized protein YndB with AHSA1/START domain
MHRLVATAALAAASALSFATPGRCEVVAAEAGGFVTRSAVSIAAPPARVYSQFVGIGRWWNEAHTWSGKAANMSIEVAPGGCWCERIDGGGFVEHGRVIYAAPGKILRFRAALGPLHEAAALGTLTVAFEPEDGGKTKLTLTYAGVLFQPQTGAAPLAPLIDQVLMEQVQRLKRHVEGAAASR